MSDNGSKDVLSPDEIVKRFQIQMSPCPDTPELQRINSEVANKYQEASVYCMKAKHTYAQVARRYNATKDELLLEVAQEQRKKAKADKLTAAEERKAEASQRLNKHKVADQLEKTEYYVEVWNTVLRNLKFVSGRIGDAIIEDASEKKLLSAVRIAEKTTTTDKNTIWRSGPGPEGA